MMRLTDNCHRLPLLVGPGGQDGMVSGADAKRIVAPLSLDLDAYRRSGNLLFSFVSDPDKRAVRNAQDELIVSVSAGAGDERLVQTGNYVGRFTCQGVQFDIRSRFGDAFMQRMLNFANDIFIDDGYVPGKRDIDGPDYARMMLYLLFAQALEKAFLLGLPKSYHSVAYHDSAVRGRIDTARFIRSDIPFHGKVASVSREQRESQPVVDVLARAIRAIEGNGGREMLRRVAHVRAHLVERKSGKLVSAATIAKAKADKGLQNPIFAPYKRVLELAEMVIRSESTQPLAGGAARSQGFLINVAELFEIYVGKLLARRFPDWRVTSPKIDLHRGRFYERKIIPDIVMEHGDGRVAVFDTKYKRMHYRERNQHGAGDVDRNDFFQIATYMAYYRQRRDCRLVLGGLLYPLADDPDTLRCHDGWMTDDSVDFIVDGVRAAGDEATGFEAVIARESAFAGRISALLDAHA